MSVQRRDILIAGIGTFASLGHSASALADKPNSLRLYHIHTGEDLNISYRVNGQVVHEAVEAISYLLRDFRTGGVQAFDLDLLDSLSILYDRFDRRGRFEVISGYRSPRTNKALRRVTSGVAEDSLHMSGCAIDIRLTGAATDDLHTAAIELGHGGVGYYPKSDFVHLDTGPVRTW